MSAKRSRSEAKPASDTNDQVIRNGTDKSAFDGAHSTRSDYQNVRLLRVLFWTVVADIEKELRSRVHTIAEKVNYKV
jgi:hypothetical protein